ncbi:unnamed protein product [Arctia plantaginis]|nr:unnamed protein product [Arctia plantaginis]
MVTNDKSDFWQGTYYDFYFNSGHVYGIELKDDFVFKVCVEAEFHTLYDQAGLMIYLDEKHWVKAGIEFNDGQPLIASVVTDELSDWATGIFPGDPKKFYIRITKKGTAICIKYSSDDVNWTLLRLFSMPLRDKYFIGPLSCTPKREGLRVQFSELSITEPGEDILHSN